MNKKKILNVLNSATKEIQNKSPEELKLYHIIVNQRQWITKAVQLLKQLETAGTDVSYDDDYSDYDDYSRDPWIEDCCPCCRCIGDHYDDCELNRLLKEAEEL